MNPPRTAVLKKEIVGINSGIISYPRMKMEGRKIVLPNMPIMGTETGCFIGLQTTTPHAIHS